MGGRSWTELFFLDEAVALAAGHRPCFFCRRAAAEAFRTAWGKAKGGKVPLAPEMDAVLHKERLGRSRKRVHAIPGPVAELPDGTVIAAGGEAYTIVEERRFLWVSGVLRGAAAGRGSGQFPPGSLPGGAAVPRVLPFKSTSWHRLA